jgi:hypothetical protein
MVPARPHGVPAELRNRVHLDAERAHWAIRPARSFEEFAGFFFVGKGWIGKIAHVAVPPKGKQPYHGQSVQSSTYLPALAPPLPGGARYLAEWDFKFNTRKMKDGERPALALKGIEGKRLTYRAADRSENP